ncbi:MAG: acyl-CoA dehydrogenase family protein [Saprospiraceae bacterium]|nr:acyl-CoA dehydrogenase family protein [Saprospiraceae bacterium]
MQDTVSKTNVLPGGAFLIKDTPANQTFIPEDFNEEQRMVKAMVNDFIKNEIDPVRPQVEKQEGNYSVKLLEKAAELGILGSHMPEIYGGMEMDTNTNTLICETFGPGGSWIVAYAAHTGIGMLPILYFGNEAQKSKYLPGLISGQLKASYCLTEPSSGSDALAAKTKAELNAEGTHYILNGQKMWITNAGFADIFIVFAQIDGDKFTGFIVERELEGFTLGAEEEKLGIKGSSTRQIFLENVKVPTENVLGEVGKGHLIAFNALNDGRFKLGAMCIGGAKGSFNSGIKYANERHQFKVPISSFGAIKRKLAQQAVHIFAAESAQYRTSQLMQSKKAELRAAGEDFASAKLKAADEYAIECAILKVVGSEALDFVVDETLQIHGGMGYSEEGTAARAYRDARINRIFEGTNEINRLLSVDMLLKRAMKGRLDIVSPAWEVQKELSSMPSMDLPTGTYGKEYKALKDFKKLVLMVAGAAAKMQMDGELDLKNEQEIITNVADMLIDVFLVESTLLRVDKLSGMETKVPQEVSDAMLKILIHDKTSSMQKNAADALGSFAGGDLLKTMLMGLKRYTKYPVQNVKELGRTIADYAIEQDGSFL